MSMKEARKNNPLLGLVYEPGKVRKNTPMATCHKAMDAYVETTLSNPDDLGNKGKAYEVELRRAINPRTKTLRCQKQGLEDIRFVINGKRVNLECKTGGGEIANNLWFDDWRTEFDPERDLKFDYIAYQLEYTHKPNEVINDTVIMTKEAFIRWCAGYTGDYRKWLTYKTKEGRMMIANPTSSKKRRAYAEGLMDWALGQEEGCYMVDEFKAMMGR